MADNLIYLINRKFNLKLTRYITVNLTIVLWIILFNINYGQDLDVYFGTYQDDCKLPKITFNFSDEGINDLFIREKPIPNNQVKYDVLGIFGESLILSIQFEEKDTLSVIKCFIVIDKQQFIISSGYYYNVKWDEQMHSQTVIDRFSFELMRKPF